MKFDGCREFRGLKLTADHTPLPQAWGVVPVGVDKRSDVIEMSKFGAIGWGGNSGFQALNVAIQFMCRRIILVGYDMSLANGVHWHGRHPSGMNNPSESNIARWRRCLDGAADALDAVGIDIINASPVSTLKRYPKMTLLEAFEHHARLA